jgi:Ribonuclease HII
MIVEPTLRAESELCRAGSTLVIGCDEVGRGAIAGPVAVGMVVLDPALIRLGRRRMPVGLRDSKLLAEPRREELDPLCRAWAVRHAVGLASADEIDRFGIIAALGIAGARALERLTAQGGDFDGATMLLDGNHDYLSAAAPGCPSVVTRIKGDQTCGSVAAASVIAKVHRDRMMIERDAVTPGYGWVRNKGYASAEHLEAIGVLGPSDFHRRTWLRESAA